jgi:glucosamine-6-phosphate deaminase
MQIEILDSREQMAAAAAAQGAALIRQAISDRGTANIIVATGSSQFELLANLSKAEQIGWERVTLFHLDEYIGLPITHPASFRLYLWKRFVQQLPVPLAAFHCLNGESDSEAECRRVSELIARCPIDVAFVGIGENGHLAFNDPPADFDTTEPYIVVQLDEACRRQQLGEGWFPDFEAVPTQAISMSIRQIMMSRSIVCTVPDERKSVAVQAAVEGPVTPTVPASILQQHEEVTLFLDQTAASRLTQ